MLVWHEFAHIANGHFEYLENSQANAILVEMQRLGAGQRPPDFTRQAIEMDADRTAAAIGIFDCIHSTHEDFKRIAAMPKDALFAWTFAISGMLAIWRLGYRYDGTDPYHPTTGLRFQLIVQVIQSLFASQYPEVAQKARQIMFDAGEQFLIATKAIEGDLTDDETWALVRESDSSDVEDYRAKIVARW